MYKTTIVKKKIAFFKSYFLPRYKHQRSLKRQRSERIWNCKASDFESEASGFNPRSRSYFFKNVLLILCLEQFIVVNLIWKISSMDIFEYFPVLLVYYLSRTYFKFETIIVCVHKSLVLVRVLIIVGLNYFIVNSLIQNT